MSVPLVAILTLIFGQAAPPAPSSASPPSGEAVSLTGKVITLSEALKAAGLVFDDGPVERQVVLSAADGSLVPLISDDASRALFLDERLRGRPIKMQGRRYPGLPYLQVVLFQVREEGDWRTPEYYCEVCTISVRYPQVCPCCQGPMVLRMKPER